MKNLQSIISKSTISPKQKYLFKYTNKYLCKLKRYKFRAQPLKLAVSVLKFWKAFNNPDINEIQFLNFSKYNHIQINIANNKTGEHLLTPVVLNVLINSSITHQPWFMCNNTFLILVFPHNSQLHVFNIEKIQCIDILKNYSTKFVKLQSSLLASKTTYKATTNLSNQFINILFSKYSTHFYKVNTKSVKFSIIKSSIKSILKHRKYSKKKQLFKNHTKKFSKKWYQFELKKFKRFKSRYDGRDLPKEMTAFTIHKINSFSLRKWLFIRYQERISFIKNSIAEEINRNKRLKELFKSSNKRKTSKKKKNKKKQKKIILKYSRFKKKPRNKKPLPKVKIINIQSKSTIPSKSTKVFKRSLIKSLKYRKKYVKTAKIKFLKRLSFKNKYSVWRKVSKYSVQSKRIEKTLKNINKQINYKLKWLNYYEFKAFRWKFQKKRWYLIMSRWKRLGEFRRMLRNAWRNYRKLQKNFIFIKLLRANFRYILGINEQDLLKKWVKIRRGTNLNNTISSIEYLNQALQLKLDGLSLFFGFAPNRLMAQEFVRFGGLRINGTINTDSNFSLQQGDMLQVDNKVIQEIRVLYKDAHWSSVRARLKFVPFLQVQWSIMLFILVRWPQSHELFEESILNQRWVRFFIRYFPVRVSKYTKAKIKWYKY